MKNIFFLILISLFFVSCGQESTDPTIIENNTTIIYTNFVTNIGGTNSTYSTNFVLFDPFDISQTTNYNETNYWIYSNSLFNVNKYITVKGYDSGNDVWDIIKIIINNGYIFIPLTASGYPEFSIDVYWN